MSELKSLLDLLNSAGIKPLKPLPESPEIESLTDHSFKAGPGSLFVAIHGTTVDSHRFLAQAAEQGAAAAIIEDDYEGPLPDIPVVRVNDTRRALGLLAHAFQGHPAKQMLTCAVTGTNGKSTVAHLMEGIFNAADRNPGLISTIRIRFGETTYPATHTTPGPLDIAGHLAEMRDAGVDALSMEVSSHGLHQHRVAGLSFDCGVLTNITSEHLDYHGNLDQYAAVKKCLFDDYTRGNRVLNLDDAYGRRWADEYKDRLVTYGRSEDARIRLIEAESTLSGTNLKVALPDGTLEIRSPMKGMFNVENLLAATAAGHALGFPAEQIRNGLESVEPVDGRFELVDEGQDFGVIVDFAHTADALERVFSHARQLTQGRLIAVFGAGGDRDAGKRGPMGEAAGRWCDWIMVTNDNPRTEDPKKIADAVVGGVMKTVSKSARVEMILDRRQAIQAAVEEARSGDLILIAGKGHEAYEMIGNRLILFDDRNISRLAIREKLQK